LVTTQGAHPPNPSPPQPQTTTPTQTPPQPQNEIGNVLLLTPRGLAYLPSDTTGGTSEPLPNAAGAALLTLLYANHDTKKPLNAVTKSKLECFALGQVGGWRW